jgi:hypothetical protein
LISNFFGEWGGEDILKIGDIGVIGLIGAIKSYCTKWV